MMGHNRDLTSDNRSGDLDTERSRNEGLEVWSKTSNISKNCIQSMVGYTGRNWQKQWKGDIWKTTESNTPRRLGAQMNPFCTAIQFFISH